MPVIVSSVGVQCLAHHLGAPPNDCVALLGADDQRRQVLPDRDRLIEVAYLSSRSRRAQAGAILIL
jgi:hypothetical protein